MNRLTTPVDSQTASGGTATFTGVNVVGAGTWYLDVEVQSATDCRNYYVLRDVVNDVIPAATSSNYLLLSYDRANDETRFGTDTGIPVTTVVVVP